MRRFIYVFLAAIAMIAPACAQSPQLSRFCANLDQNTAPASESCIRWYFACNMGTPASNPKPPSDQLTYLTRYRLLVHATLRLVETRCERFSYIEAWAAMQAHLELSQPNPQTR
jgi:hypothetical protein